MDYTLALALVDFLPVVFTALGMFLVARMVAHTGQAQGQMAMLGASLIVAGGLLKATWKLIMAASAGATDIRWLDNGLFILMAPGFVLMSAAVWCAVRAVRGRTLGAVWPAPLITITLMLAGSIVLAVRTPDSPAWERLLLGVMVLATVITSTQLIVFAFRQQMPFMGALFVVNLVGVFVLNGLARIEDQTIALQWLEESINTVAWLAFAFAAWRVYAYTRATFRVDAGQPPMEARQLASSE